MTHDEITIAPARQDDLAEVVNLCMMVEEQHERYWPLRWQRRPGIREGYLKWLEGHLADEKMLILAARTQGGLVVGALLAVIEQEIPIYTYREFAFIHDVAVAQDYQGRGIGRRLLEETRTWAKGRGVNQVRLMVARQNGEAEKLFAKVGFQETYREMVWPVE